MQRPISIAVVAALVVALAACGDSGTTNAPEAEVTPFHTIPDDFATVSGGADCTLSGTGGSGLRVSCAVDMSDPRVSGTEIADRIRIVERDGTGYIWVSEEATITNGEGTWRGIIQTADDGSQRNGEGHFVGEGSYEGLEHHYYWSVNKADEHIRTGWVYSTDQ